MILNNINNKCYIGSSVNIRKRFYEHKHTLRKNKHHSSHLQNAWNKYKEENFSFIVLEKIEDIELLISKEIHWIKLKDSLDPKKGYNIGIPSKNDELKLREDSIIKLKIQSYKQFYKDSEISLEEFLKGKRKRHLIKKRNITKKVFVFDMYTGEMIHIFNSGVELRNSLGCQKSYYERIINKPNLTFKKMIFITEDKYDSNIVYKKQYKKPKQYIKKGPFKGFPIEAINIKTKEVFLFDNKKELANFLNSSVKYINKVLYENKKSYKGYTFKLIKEKPTL